MSKVPLQNIFYILCKFKTAIIVIHGYTLNVLLMYRSEEKSNEPTGFDQDLYLKAETVFDWSRDKDPEVKKKKIQLCVDRIKKLLKFRGLVRLVYVTFLRCLLFITFLKYILYNCMLLITQVTVFHLDDVDTTNEIDQAILYALLKANKANAQTQLNLALAWNRCDIARQEIFTIENRAQWQVIVPKQIHNSGCKLCICY